MDSGNKNLVNIGDWIKSVKDKIVNAQSSASFKVNAQMLQLYWDIGNSILLAQEKNGWGTHIVDKLSGELKSKFTHTNGFSVRNLKYMRSFAKQYPKFPIMQVPLAQNNNE